MIAFCAGIFIPLEEVSSLGLRISGNKHFSFKLQMNRTLGSLKLPPCSGMILKHSLIEGESSGKVERIKAIKFPINYIKANSGRV